MRQLKVSILCGVVMRHDAISSMALRHLNAIAHWGKTQGYDVDARIYAIASGVSDPRVHVTGWTATSLPIDEHFQSSNLVLAEFGIMYPLFPLIGFAPPGAKKVVAYYGLTPPALVAPDKAQVMHDSYQQAAAMLGVDEIVTTSEFLVDELARMGVDPKRISNLHLPLLLKASEARATTKRKADEPLRLAYLGRMVYAKGISDLIDAVIALNASGRDFTLRLMGNADMSDTRYLDGLKQQVIAANLGERVTFNLNLSDAEVSRTLASSDALVIPSYHEGFCVPVIEAMNCGCFAITSDRGSLPEVAGGLGRTFKARDAAGLCAALIELDDAIGQGQFPTDQGLLPIEEWQGKVRDYIKTFDPAEYDRRFIGRVMSGVQGAVDDPARLAANRLATHSRIEALKGIMATPAPPIATPGLDIAVEQILGVDRLKRVEAKKTDSPPRRDFHHHVVDIPPSQHAITAKIVEIMLLPPDQFIHELYVFLLKRAPDPEAMTTQLAKVSGGMPRIKIVDIVARSPECAARGWETDWLFDFAHLRARTDYVQEVIRMMRLTDEEFLSAAYGLFLGRRPDREGFAFLSQKLSEGMPRVELVRFLVKSQEGRNRLIEIDWVDRPDLGKPAPVPGLAKRAARRLRRMMGQ